MYTVISHLEIMQILLQLLHTCFAVVSGSKSGHTRTEFQIVFVQGQVFLEAERRGKTFVGKAVRDCLIVRTHTWVSSVTC